ncbi:MAG: hypothetical protein JWL90_1880 [Chthoniobacteraceae bacterium]|nr:hypothetical protein [Chthoniobacteraceae bacterium]
MSLSSFPIPANADGQYDVRLGIPPGCVHFLGKRLTVTCRALGIECAAAIIGDAKRKKFGPLLDGVIIRAADQEKLEEGVRKRDASRPSEEQKAAIKSKKQESDTSAFTADIRRQFPAMPETDVQACAAHATEIGSGRVGRSSLAKNTTGKAVVAFVRHKYTPYDALLASGVSRDDARAQILSSVTEKVNEWSPQQQIEVKPSRPSKRGRRLAKI